MSGVSLGFLLEEHGLLLPSFRTESIMSRIDYEIVGINMHRLR